MGNAGLKQHYETASKTGVLQISDQKLKDIPHEVINLCEVLRNLDLSKNKLSVVPDSISKFKHLKQLNLECNKLECLPDTLANVSKIELINVSNNLISSLPAAYCSLSNLKQIYLSGNKFAAFPKQLLGLKNLEVVDLSRNKISEIPVGMAELYATELNLSQNEISIISEDMHMAPKLKILRLEENCLSIDAIRPSLLRDSKLHTINLEGNLFELKQLALMEGYNEYTERYTAMKKKMF